MSNRGRGKQTAPAAPPASQIVPAKSETIAKFSTTTPGTSFADAMRKKREASGMASVPSRPPAAAPDEDDEQGPSSATPPPVEPMDNVDYEAKDGGASDSLTPPFQRQYFERWGDDTPSPFVPKNKAAAVPFLDAVPPLSAAVPPPANPPAPKPKFSATAATYASQKDRVALPSSVKAPVANITFSSTPPAPPAPAPPVVASPKRTAPPQKAPAVTPVKPTVTHDTPPERPASPPVTQTRTPAATTPAASPKQQTPIPTPDATQQNPSSPGRRSRTVDVQTNPVKIGPSVNVVDSTTQTDAPPQGQSTPTQQAAAPRSAPSSRSNQPPRQPPPDFRGGHDTSQDEMSALIPWYDANYENYDSTAGGPYAGARWGPYNTSNQNGGAFPGYPAGGNRRPPFGTELPVLPQGARPQGQRNNFSHPSQRSGPQQQPWPGGYPPQGYPQGPPPGYPGFPQQMPPQRSFMPPYQPGYPSGPGAYPPGAAGYPPDMGGGVPPQNMPSKRPHSNTGFVQH